MIRRGALLLLLGGLALGARAGETLNIFAWSEYIPQAVLDAFGRETGATVSYETYASGEEMLSKLLAGAASYDLIQPPDYIAETLIRHGLLARLDLARIPRLANIGPEYLHLPHDPAQQYTIPYMVGTVGIVVNRERVREPVRGYQDVFSPAHAGRIVILNDSREIVSWALEVLGLPINDLTPANLARARPLLAAWLPRVRVYDSDSPKTALLNGDVDLGVVWSGEAALLHNENPKFVYILPAEGAHQFVDVLAIPVQAPHPAIATRFLDYILRPEVSKRISDAFPYTNPNLAARRLLSPAQLANPASYPAVGKLATFRDVGRAAAAVDRLVTDLKSAR